MWQGRCDKPLGMGRGLSMNQGDTRARKAAAKGPIARSQAAEKTLPLPPDEVESMPFENQEAVPEAVGRTTSG